LALIGWLPGFARRKTTTGIQRIPPPITTILTIWAVYLLYQTTGGAI